MSERQSEREAIKKYIKHREESNNGREEERCFNCGREVLKDVTEGEEWSDEASLREKW